MLEIAYKTRALISYCKNTNFRTALRIVNFVNGENLRKMVLLKAVSYII